LEETVRLDPKYFWAHVKLGIGYKNLRKYDQAIKHLNTAISLELKNEWAYIELGLTYNQKGEYDKAIENLNEAISLEPKNEWAYRALGLAYEGQGEYDRAIENFRRAIEIEPTKWAYAGIADTYTLKRDYKEARASVERALEVDKTYEDAHIILYSINIAQKRYEDAIKRLEEAVELIPKSAALHTSLGDAYRRTKTWDKALEHIKKAIELSPKYAYAYGVLSNTQVDQGRYEDAIDSAKKAIKYYPDYEDPYLSIGKAYHEIKRDSDAVEVLKGYLEKDADNLFALTVLGFVYQEYLHKYPDAYRSYEKAYKRKPTSLGIRANFAEANLTTRRFDAAFDLANEVLKDPSISPEGKLSMRLIAVSSLLLQGKVSKAISELGEFSRTHRNISEEYERSWKFLGIKKFVKGYDEIGPIEKSLILDLIDILESETKKDADMKLEEFDSSLDETFARLQKR
jgi:tetratricopeptide (TPR) repeat protein